MSVTLQRMTAVALAAAASVVSVYAFEASISGGAGLSPQASESLPASCLTTNHGAGEALVRRNPASRRVLVPPGAREALLCRYWGYGIEQTKATPARDGKLATERRLSRRSLVRALTRDFNRTVPAPGMYACPLDEGANLYTAFSYADQPIVVVEIHLSGCGFASNGFGQGGFPPPRLVDRLERLTRYAARVP